MAIDLNAARSKYERNAPAAAQDLVDGYVRRTDKLARAASEDAEKNYAAGVAEASQRKSRQKALRKLNEGDLNAAMQAKGAAAYSAGVQLGAPKWANGFSPYAQTIDTTVASLPARSRDPVANVNARVVPVVKALADKKKQMG